MKQESRFTPEERAAQSLYWTIVPNITTSYLPETEGRYRLNSRETKQVFKDIKVSESGKYQNLLISPFQPNRMHNKPTLCVSYAANNRQSEHFSIPAKTGAP